MISGSTETQIAVSSILTAFPAQTEPAANENTHGELDALDFEELERLANSDDETQQLEARKMISNRLLELGFEDPEEIIGDWAITGDNPPQVVMAHMRKTEELVRYNKEIPSVLFREFGLRAFARYPTYIMLSLYDNRGDTESPWVLVANAVGDSEEITPLPGMVTWTDVYDRVYTFCVCNRFRLRVEEFKTAREAGNLAESFHDIYPKAALAIVGAHGNRKCVAASKDNDLNYQEIEAMLRPVLEDGSPVVLGSCSTGDDASIEAKAPIAQKLAEQTGYSVWAPSSDCKLAKLKLEVSNRQISVKDATYSALARNNPNLTRRFDRGLI